MDPGEGRLLGKPPGPTVSRIKQQLDLFGVWLGRWRKAEVVSKGKFVFEIAGRHHCLTFPLYRAFAPVQGSESSRGSIGEIRLKKFFEGIIAAGDLAPRTASRPRADCFQKIQVDFQTSLPSDLTASTTAGR
jgi:hypothetical protein